jgi:hypothetical protein
MLDLCLSSNQNLCLQDQKAAEELASYFITVMAKRMMLSIYSYLSMKILKNVKKELESFIRYRLPHGIIESSTGHECFSKKIFLIEASDLVLWYQMNWILNTYRVRTKNKDSF